METSNPWEQLTQISNFNSIDLQSMGQVFLLFYNLLLGLNPAISFMVLSRMSKQ